MVRPLTVLWIVTVAIGLLVVSPVYAATQAANQRVMIEVPSSLVISSSQNDFLLQFPDTYQGSETNSITVNYSISANGMMQADGAPAILAQLDGTFSGMDFKASVGRFAKISGDTELSPSAGGFVTIRDFALPLATKANSTGSGRVLNGNLPITYKAVATSNLSSGIYARQLTITLTDI